MIHALPAEWPIKRFIETDYPEIEIWAEKRGIRPISKDLLPSVGFIVPGIAASFMYNMEGKLGYSEGTITNPEAPKEDRSKALLSIFEAIENEARNLGLKLVISNVSIPEIIKYATQRGCRIVESKAIVIKRID